MKLLISAEGVTVAIPGEPEMTPSLGIYVDRVVDLTGVPYTNEDEAKLADSSEIPPTPKFVAEAGVGLGYINRLSEMLMVPYPGTIQVRPSWAYSGRFHDLAEVVHWTCSAHHMVSLSIPALYTPVCNYSVDDLVKSVDAYITGITRISEAHVGKRSLGEMLKEPLANGATLAGLNAT